jgi:DNA-directed RNA polymerase II subunit RPB9
METKLLYACRRCGHQEEALNPIVYRHEITVQERYYICILLATASN